MTSINNHFASLPGIINQQKPLILIDWAVEHHQQLAAGAIEGAKVVVLKPYQDGISQIIHTLQAYPHYTSIHIVSHGAPGYLPLGNSQLSLDTLKDYGDYLKPWLEGKNLFLYGCHVAAGDAGAEFIAKLHQLTGAEIAASATLTGNAALGGDWDLSVTTGNVEGTVAFNHSTQATYPGVLATVTNNNDDGAGSLRDAIANATAGEVIDFDESLSGQTINLTEEIRISTAVTITGLGADQLTIDAGGNGRIFDISNNSADLDLTISGLTLTGGNVDNGGGAISNRENLTLTDVIIESNNARNGGAILNRGGGNLTIENSTINDNSSDGDGGGITNNGGDINIINSTISGNISATNGGAIANNGTIRISNTTITENSSSGGGISGVATSGTIDVISSIIAGNDGNSDVGIPDGAAGSFNSLGNNLIGNGNGVIDSADGDIIGSGGNPADPGLEALGDNGGSTPTHALQVNSQAIDAGDADGLNRDQRGESIVDGNGDGDSTIDIGAFEFQGNPGDLPVISIAEGTTAVEVGPVNGSFDISLSQPADNPLTVNFTLSGAAVNTADYNFDQGASTNIEAIDTDNNTITIAAGQTSATLVFVPVGDDVEETESVELTLDEGSGYTLDPEPNDITASVAILDEPLPSISLSASETEVAEDGGTLTYTVSRDSGTTGELAVNLAFDTNASNFEAEDFSLAIDGNDVTITDNAFSVTIPDGASSVEVTLTAAADGGTDNETVKLDLVASDSYQLDSANATTTITIIDELTPPTVSISPTTDDIAEGENGQFTVSRSADNTVNDLEVTLNINGNSTTENGDFTINVGGQDIPAADSTFTVTIPNGQTDATFSVTANADDDADAETLTLDIGASADGSYNLDADNDSTTINITELGIPVSLTASDAQATEAGDTGAYTISRGDDTTGDLTVNLQVDTTESNFEEGDFTLTAGDADVAITNNSLSVTIPNGQSDITLTLTPAQDDDFEDESIKLDLASGTGYAIGDPSTGTVTIDDDDIDPNPGEGNVGRDVTSSNFILGGTAGEAVNLKFELTGRNTTAVNEIGVFRVDDASGAVGGISPNNANYVNAVLQNSQTVFSAFSQSTNFFGNAERILEGQFNAGDQLRFYLIPNGTANSVLSGDTAASSVRFSANTTQLNVNELANGQFTLAWEDGQGVNDLNDLILNFGTTTESAPLGLVQQGTDELLDLSSQVGNQVQLTYSVVSDAGFSNIGGVFAMNSVAGAVTDPTTGAVLNPGDAGYAQAAVANSVAEFDADGLATFTVGGQGLYGVYILPDGNAGEALFSVAGANSQGFDQSRLFGNNVIGFEDIAGGGDLDYNDFAVQFDVQQLA